MESSKASLAPVADIVDDRRDIHRPMLDRIDEGVRLLVLLFSAVLDRFDVGFLSLSSPLTGVWLELEDSVFTSSSSAKDCS